MTNLAELNWTWQAVVLQALCTPAGPGVANCSCREGFAGDGYQCYSTIGREISAVSQLSSLNQLIQVSTHTHTHF